jgi:hypothetical protein
LENGWFCGNIRSILGDGTDIAFWKGRWIGSSTLRDMFPSLFIISTQPDGNVSDMGSWESDNWAWSLDWSTVLTENELVEEQELLLLLDHIQPGRGELDRHRWLAHAAGFFTVKTAYNMLLQRLVLPEFDEETTQALKLSWLNNVPSKVSIFGWRLLINKIPTREALFNKGIITNNHERCCDLCFRENEDTNHIFFNCSRSVEVWRIIIRWMGIKAIPFANICNHFILFGNSLKEATNKRSRHIIWLATI